MAAKFINGRGDEFNPQYGDVNWKPRLNNRLEEREVELTPIDYVETGKPPMQVTQENTHIFINQIADELDCVVVNYTHDGEGVGTWYFREKFGEGEFDKIVAAIGTWATRTITLYPLEFVVEQYEGFHTSDIGEYIPEDW